jgi:hypothetical protein
MEPKQLAAAQGWSWIKQGYALFMKAPLLWIVLLIIAFVAALALSNVPVVGEPLVSLLMPVVLVGLMSGARDLQQGEELELAHLFCGFRKFTTQLVTLGGIALVAQFAIFGVMLMAGGGALVSIMMSHDTISDPNVMAQAIAGAGFAVLVGLVLFSALMMAMQYAPMLVYFQGLAPIAALKLSLRAFLNNIGAMSVYGATFIALLGWLVLLPLTFTSLYASYCEIFPVVVEVPPPVNEAFAPHDEQT